PLPRMCALHAPGIDSRRRAPVDRRDHEAGSAAGSRDRRSDVMDRRAFLGPFGLLAAPLAAEAQRAAMPVIGVLHGVLAAQWTDRMVGFTEGWPRGALPKVAT